MIRQGDHHGSELRQLERISSYLGILLRQEGYIRWLLEKRQLSRRYPQMELYHELGQLAAASSSFEEAARAFRSWKQRHFLRIGGREWLGLADFQETTSQLSDLAEVALQVGLEVLSRSPSWWLGSRGGRNLQPDFLSSLVVMGFGKLGGSELNYVSDIDLAFFCSSQRSQAEGPGPSDPDLERFCSALTRLLRDQIGGDRVFQVDLRLRPGGKDAQLIASYEAAVDHYQIQGRAWERQALLKARPVAGERSLGRAFLQELRPFIFRRFLDFQALDELRSMRDRILAETGHSFNPDAYDVKLGAGGIREIEFITQSFQLVYGGRLRDLDEPNTLRCLDKLKTLSLLPAGTVDSLKQAYVFLRRVEHWIQLDQNRPGRKLPEKQEKRQRLAEAMGFENAEGFLGTLTDLSRTVHEHFQSLFGGDQRRQERTGSSPDTGSSAKNGSDGRPDLSPELTRLMEAFDPSVGCTVAQVMHEYASGEADRGSKGVSARVANFLQQTRRRPGLCRLLDSHPPWLSALFDSLLKSEFVASLLAHQPSLIEGLSPSLLEEPGCSLPDQPPPGSIVQSCQSYEEALEWIRRLKNERLLAAALVDISRGLGLNRLTAYLSAIADFVIRETLEAVSALSSQQGEGQLSVLGLGKLGSRQMGWLSDLDVMFVYASGKEPAEPERIPEGLVRRIQRFMRMLSTPLQEGPGYPVDTALRPTGNYGPLVVTEKRWREYYSSEADVWEMQSLLRMRHIAGDETLGKRLQDMASSFCYRQRRPEQVWPRLCHLRQRMEQERTQESDERIDLKLGFGGTADLEFLVQGQQLLAGSGNPDLLGGNTSQLLPAALEQTGLRSAEIEFYTVGLETLFLLEQRLQLFSNLSGGRLRKEQLSELKAWGLWPPEGCQSLAESWEDVLRLRRRIRQLWTSVCKA